MNEEIYNLMYPEYNHIDVELIIPTKPLSRKEYVAIEGTDVKVAKLSHVDDYNDLINFAIDINDWQYAYALVRRKQKFLNR